MRNVFLLKLLMRISREVKKSGKKGTDIILQAVKEVDEGSHEKAEDAINYDDDDENEEKEKGSKKKSAGGSGSKTKEKIEEEE